jgi:hypothetical protein
MSETNLKTAIAEMTPAMAKKILDRNERNRALRPDYVRQLAGAMERGEWVVNGEPVQIADDGTLLNGQHRLSAVVESETSVPMLVVRGLPAETRTTMDVGTRRTLSDVLALHGETDTTNLGAVLGLLYRYRTGARLDYSSRTAPTIVQALELLEKEKGLREALHEARHVFRETRMRLSVAALLLYLFEEADPKAGQGFFDALCHPEGEKRGSAVRKLRSHLDRIRSKRKYRFSTAVLSAMTIKAFNAWREGRQVENLAYRAGGPNPEPFPKILSRVEIESG